MSPPTSLLRQLDAYRPFDPREAQMRDRLASFVREHGPAAFDRSLAIGHLTASAWIVDPTRAHAVLLHHRKLDRWLQPGGHLEGETELLDAARREAREESGLQRLRPLGGGIYDLDIHPIPARGAEAAHEHFDVRFAFEADPAEALSGNAESQAVRWVDLAELERYGVDASVRRLAAKTALL